MRKYVNITGISEVMKNIEKELTNIKLVSEVGMMQVATLVKKSMDTQSPTIPVDLTNLDKSWFVVTTTQRRAGGRGFKGAYAARLSEVHTKELKIAEGYTWRNKHKTSMIMGFSTPYAIYIHEAPSTYNWTKPGSGPKFFQAALERNKSKIIEILQLSINKRNKNQAS